MARRITVVTAGHLSTCPRMLKAADALHEAGYVIRVVSVQHTPWATQADAALRRTRTWQWDPVDAARASAPVEWLTSGVRFRGARSCAGLIGPRAPRCVTVHAFSRVHAPLVRAILREPADLIYGGTTGALAAVAEAGRRSSTPFSVDFEDFHCGEHDESAEGRLTNRLADEIMRDVLNGARFVTGGSAAIAAACTERFGTAVVPIHNVFPLPRVAPSPRRRRTGPLRCYWFSQTIGEGRGLEDVVRALGRVSIPGELHLRGTADTAYVASLEALARECAPGLMLHLHAPAEPGAMVDACREYDAGVSVDQGAVPNRTLNLGNKALTYPLAGVPVILTRTPGQRQFADDLGEGALTYAPGQIEALADGLRTWAVDDRAWARACEASWEAARRRWHWEHPGERGALLRCVAEAVA